MGENPDPQHTVPATVATTAIDALRSSPALLWLILLVAITLGLTAWSVQKAQERQQAIIERLMDRCLMNYERRNTRWPVSRQQHAKEMEP